MSSDQSSEFNLVISGVGGQGAILASDIIGKAAVSAGLSVRAAETHGMAQRGGSVINHIRLGYDLGSMITVKGADLLMALEPAEALRYVDFLSEDGVVVVNTAPVCPVTVMAGLCSYPDISEIIETLEESHDVKAFNAFELAIEAGHPQAMNVVMVGAISKYLPISDDQLLEAIRELVPPKTIDINVKAFELGKKAISEQA